MVTKQLRRFVSLFSFLSLFLGIGWIASSEAGAAGEMQMGQPNVASAATRLYTDHSNSGVLIEQVRNTGHSIHAVNNGYSNNDMQGNAVHAWVGGSNKYPSFAIKATAENPNRSDVKGYGVKAPGAQFSTGTSGKAALYLRRSGPDDLYGQSCPAKGTLINRAGKIYFCRGYSTSSNYGTWRKLYLY